MENFIFDIGGLIGLFLGSSILSILELLLGTFRIVRNYTKTVWNLIKLRRQKKVEEQAQFRKNTLSRRSIATIYSQGSENVELDVVDLEN